MEKRAIIAAMLMAGLLMVYQFLFVKPEPPRPAPAGQKAEAPVSQGSSPSAVSTPRPVSATSPPPAKEAPPAPGADGGRRHALVPGRGRQQRGRDQGVGAQVPRARSRSS